MHCQVADVTHALQQPAGKKVYSRISDMPLLV
jgi:hypothetical protein